ncbi:probable LRR receptor-like serine/threonine-protein kinase At1g05700 isoform X4 [Nymphaea colorata]|uniref:probable LRR receptor-like serine/threonine-protein kinase At1g05700 isoform X3 n=1 Tax=Nymphaea colorata TaxID=210225 RepID=UPI00214EBB27|nr:probable LRR receptor-like serine/threonine-protein kinase At1g05700 isoform X3 [Nymphaea colorata]XP_049931826.1 probable LRR receptor-like serine/threonine-protein kinase At1g05700 isoform X4 [Nymphaea colorata]
MLPMFMMINSFGIFLLLCHSSTLLLATAQKGFLNIDCGLPANSTYKSEINLDYVADSKFINNGIIKQLPNINLPKIYQTLRYFPDHKRNCYGLPVTQGTNYLVRASFIYGNYDGSNMSPSFKLYLGVDLWETVTLQNATQMYRTEIFGSAVTGNMSVCLVNTSTGVPFISGLELRPLTGADGYKVNATSSLVTFQRIDVGGREPVRYPDDKFDRIWSPDSAKNGTRISTNMALKPELYPRFYPPFTVMRTAVNSSSPIPITFSGKPDDSYHWVFYFAEVLPPTGHRNLTIKLNGDDWYGPIALEYRDIMAIFTKLPQQYSQYSFTVEANNGSDYGPILNAYEVFRFVHPSGAATLPQDVAAIKAVKDYYKIEKNWNADPCLPTDAPWEGLSCNFDNPSSPRIESLDLSNGGLSGAVASYLSQLTALRALNLSGNRIEGLLPSFLENLPYLSLLDLSSNNLSGSIPSGLQQKAANGELTLRIGNNPHLCQQDPCYQGKASSKKRNRILTFSVVSSSVVAAIVVLLVFITINSKRKLQDNNQERNSRASGKICTFTYDEVVEITNNFERVIGKGGSCTVFYGQLRDGQEVAVKLMTGRFSQGIKEYTAEVELLMKVHHKCLVSFIGFCDEDQKMILIYEYMKKGDLQVLLSDEIETSDMLNWRQRLQIAHSVATGLEYLHNGCRPPIIHRDVKTKNILLNEKLEAKIADFGLSKMRITEETSHITTVVAGTPGYIDPEYYSKSRLTEKSDVYSFGVVLFELITGQNAVLIQGSQRVHNIDFAMPKIMSGDVASIVDPRLQGQYDVNSVWKVAETAISCTAEKGITRPTMTEIVRELEEAIDMETDHQLHSKKQSKELDSGLLSAGAALLDMDSLSHPSASRLFWIKSLEGSHLMRRQLSGYVLTELVLYSDFFCFSL